MEWLPDLVKRCLQQQAQMILGRFSPEGRDLSRALRQWQHVAKEGERRKEKMGNALLVMSPEGRAMKRGFGGWFEYAKAMRERKNKVKNALARMTPEGRAMYAGMSGLPRHGVKICVRGLGLQSAGQQSTHLAAGMRAKIC